MATRFETQLPTIKKFFEKSKQKVFLDKHFVPILGENQNDWQEKRGWKLPAYLNTTDFKELLLEHTDLKKITLTSSDNTESFTRYCYGDVSPYEMALSLAPNSYFSHGTAIFFHSLNDRLPRTIYVNKEQSKKPGKKGKLSQSGIDKAFSAPQRRSNTEYLFREYRIVLIHGKNTGNLGVIDFEGDRGEPLRVTSVERTLIDIAVRPAYGGGVYQVLEAYKGAREAASVSKLIKTLKKLDFTYPYHQVIGFYLEKAGYSKRSLKRLREDFDTSYKFYLDYGIGERVREFNSDWSLFHPKGF